MRLQQPGLVQLQAARPFKDTDLSFETLYLQIVTFLRSSQHEAHLVFLLYYFMAASILLPCHLLLPHPFYLITFSSRLFLVVSL